MRAAPAASSNGAAAVRVVPAMTVQQRQGAGGAPAVSAWLRAPPSIVTQARAGRDCRAHGRMGWCCDAVMPHWGSGVASLMTLTVREAGLSFADFDDRYRCRPNAHIA